jgi:O-antigen/teichoic acid export membrane protein
MAAHFIAAKHALGNPIAIIKLSETSRLLHFGGWMTLSNIISPLMVIADRFFITSFLGASVVAYYTIPAEFMIRLLIIPAAITSTLFPIFSMQVSKVDWLYGAALYRKSMLIIFLMMGVIAISIFVGANFAIGIWLGSDFADRSSAVASCLAIGILFNSVAQVPIAYIQGAGDARSTALIHVFEFIIYVPVLILLMQLHGILGAAMAWTLRASFDLAILHFTAVRIRR